MATRYVATAGNDANAGSLAAPWRTLAKVNSANSAGDTILFNRGDRFDGNIVTINGDGVTIGAYGSGAQPRLSGGALVTGWAAGFAGNLILNGGFESWTTGTPDSWTVAATGSGTVASAANVHHGSFSAKMAPGASAGTASVAQTVTVTGAVQHQLTFWHDDTSSPNGSTVYKIVAGGGADDGFYLQADGSWSASAHTFTATFSPAAFALETLAFTPVASTTSVTLTIAVGTTTSGTNNWVDDVAISPQSASVYSAAFTSQPTLVNAADARLVEGSDQNSLTSNQWFWVGNLLYVNLGGNPTGTVVEATVRAIIQTAHSNLTIQNVELRAAFDGGGVKFSGGSKGGLVTGCTMRFMGYNGQAGAILFSNGAGRVTSCTFTDNDLSPVFCGQNANGVEVDHCTSVRVWNQFTQGLFHATDEVVGPCSNYNVHDNYVDMTGTDSHKGCLTGGTAPNVAGQSTGGRFVNNTCIGGAWGIGCDSDNSLIMGNTCIANTAEPTFPGGGVYVGAPKDVASMTIIRNVIYGCPAGISFPGGYDKAYKRSGFVIQNNTIVDCDQNGIGISNQDLFDGAILNNAIDCPGATAGLLRVRGMGSGSLTIDHNCFYPEQSLYVIWGSGPSTYTTLAAYQAGTGQDAHSIKTSPAFTDRSGHDYTLTSGSPCIDAGTTRNVLDTTIVAGATPDIGADERIVAFAINLIALFDQYDRDSSAPFLVGDTTATINLEALWNQKYRDASVPFPIPGLNATINIEALWNQHWRDSSQPFVVTVGGS